ncbi:MAG: hypothetical protein ABJL54_02975 [Halioglobus sp.]
MKTFYRAFAVLTLAHCAAFAVADSTDAACEIYPRGGDDADVLIPCRFSQRQGYITITRSDGVTHELSPVGDAPGNFKDQDGRAIIRQSGLGDQGQIFRFPEESVYVYWNTGRLTPGDDDNWTAPFTTANFDATTRLRCKRAGDQLFARCPAGISRMENGQASITVQDQLGEQFTINFMADYVNATNREVSSRLVDDIWILEFGNGEIWEVPLAAIEGG